jgi:hypothetical protein
MTEQPWLAATFAVIMIGTAGYCLTRLAVSWRWRRPTDRHVDGMHVVMGVAMAGMLVPRLRLIWAGGWEIIFAAGTALFAWRMARTACARWARAHSVAHGARAGCQSHDAQHLLGCAAMLYMLVILGPITSRIAVPHSAAPGMLGPAAPSAVPLVLAVALLGCVAWTADRMSSMAPVAGLAARQSGLAVRVGAKGGSSLAAEAAPARAAPAGSVPAGSVPAGSAPGQPVPLSPRLSACCEIATGVTMGYMLITMLT